MQTPTGEVLQDSIADCRFPRGPVPSRLPAIPTAPNQRVFRPPHGAFSQRRALVSLAWRHRWLFEENEPFITLDFGRAFRPQGSRRRPVEIWRVDFWADDRLRIAAVYRAAPGGAGRRVSRATGVAGSAFYAVSLLLWAGSPPKQITRLWGRCMRTWDATRRACG